MDKPEIIDNNLGKVFGPSLVFAGYTVTAISLFGIISSANITTLIFASIIFLVSFIISFTTHGVQVDFNNKKLRNYSKYFFCLKSGSKQDISDFPYIAVLKFNKGYTTYSRSNRSISTVELKSEVYLLNKSHLKRILIKSFSQEQQAIDYVKEIAGISGLEYTVYNPPLSKGRRR